MEHSIQREIDHLIKWGNDIYMQISVNKTKSMLVTSQKVQTVLPTNMTLKLYIDTSPIVNVNEHKTLGLLIVRLLLWNSHVHFNTKKMHKKCTN